MTFEEMNLIAPILGAIRKSGYEAPTPIQKETIPLVLEGRDVLGCAQTGTGKTAAFALPILQRLAGEGRGRRAPGRPIRALILTPTRELAQQIYESFLTYGASRLGLDAIVIFGGVNQTPQTIKLSRGVDILVATPGRLNDLIGQGYISLSGVEIFVLDEADRMLDMGFIRDVEKVIQLLPHKRQTLFFSATMPGEVESLALRILNNPQTVKVDPVTRPVDAIHQTLYYVDKPNKKLLLAHLLRQPEVENALVFARTRHGADKVVKDLQRDGISALAIHGSKSQAQRQDALNQFKAGKIQALVATDIAARGIDIAGLSHVFNYDLPDEPEVYIHRIGRTGRAGQSGIAVSFCSIDEMKNLGAVEALIGRRLPVEESPWPMTNFTPMPTKRRGGEPVLKTQTYKEPGSRRRGAGAEPAARAYGGRTGAGGRSQTAAGRTQGRRSDAGRGPESRRTEGARVTPRRSEAPRGAEPRREGGRIAEPPIQTPKAANPPAFKVIHRSEFDRRKNSGRSNDTDGGRSPSGHRP